MSGVFQRQIERQRHQRNAHAADEPGVVQSLQNADDEFDGEGNADDELLLPVDPPPMDGQQPCAQQQIECDAPVGHQHVRPGGIVALRSHCVGDRQQEIAQLRRRQKDSGQPVQPPGLAGLLFHQNGDVLVKQIDHQHHTAQKQPVNGIVQKPRHGLQMMHRVDRDAVQRQMDQHNDQQHGKRPVQRRALSPGGKIDAGDKGQNHEKRDLHSQHTASPFATSIKAFPEKR